MEDFLSDKYPDFVLKAERAIFFYRFGILTQFPIKSNSFCTAQKIQFSPNSYISDTHKSQIYSEKSNLNMNQEPRTKNNTHYNFLRSRCDRHTDMQTDRDRHCLCCCFFFWILGLSTLNRNNRSLEIFMKPPTFLSEG